MQTTTSNFESLYTQYNVLVYNVALNYVQNYEDAEEITQDVFVQIYKSKHQFEEKAALKTELNISEDDFVISYLGSIGGWYLTAEML